LLRGLWERALYGNPLYQSTLGGAVPEALAVLVGDLRPGNAQRANDIFQGRYQFAGTEQRLLNEPPWNLAAADPAWQRELHGFGWLCDFRAAGGEAARLRARDLVRSWIVRFGTWQAEVWQPEVTGRRLAAWSAQAGFLLDGADPSFRRSFMTSLSRQARHLGRCNRRAGHGEPRLAALGGLLLSRLALTGGTGGGRHLAALGHEIERQVLADGGHVSRNPSAMLEVLGHLLTLRAALSLAQCEVPAVLESAIERLAPMVRLLRHGDGGPVFFNGGRWRDGNEIEGLLEAADVPGRAGDTAPHSGYHRLATGSTLVFIDTGAPPPPPFAAGAHAGLLSFELSSGKQRLIVNCGAHPGQKWSDMARTTAAHSTLTLEDTNAIALADDGLVPERPTVGARRREDSGAKLVEAAHDGYRERFGFKHRRSIYLAPGGDEVRGEDVLEPLHDGTQPPQPRDFAIRFHLHPEVQASLAQGGASALLKPPRGRGWTLRQSGGRLELEDSVYLGGLEIRRSLQLVVRGTTGNGETTVKWALNKAGKAPVDSAPT
jgi:uncharacterized heparinase superfamily protein